jgi:hypothetical protein
MVPDTVRTTVRADLAIGEEREEPREQNTALGKRKANISFLSLFLAIQ